MSATMPTLRDPSSWPVLPLALITSLLFSLILVVTDPLLNDDAFSYLRAAETFRQVGLAAMLEHYGWYGYPVLIAVFDVVLPGGLVASAHVLNALCYLLLTWSFVQLARQLDAAPRQNLLAALVVLLFPLLNEMRDFIIRDIGFWAFSLLALLQLLHLTQGPNLPRALAWSACTLAATLFRLEALLPAVLAPLALLASPLPRMQAVRTILQLYAGFCCCVLPLLLLAVAIDLDLPALMLFAWRYYLPLLQELGPALQADALALTGAIFTADNFPGSDNTGFGLLLLVIANTGSVLLNLAQALGLPLTLMLLAAWPRRAALLPHPLRALWLVYAGIALLLLLVFQFIMHFQTQRYATLLALLLLLLLPAQLGYWWQQAEAQGSLQRWRAWAGILVLYFSVDSLVSFGHSKTYVLEAQEWLRTELPAGAGLATNSFQLAWGSGHVAEYDKAPRELPATLEQGRERDYLALELKHSDAQGRELLEQQSELQLVVEFSNRRGDAVRIYRRKP